MQVTIKNTVTGKTKTIDASVIEFSALNTSIIKHEIINKNGKLTVKSSNEIIKYPHKIERVKDS